MSFENLPKGSILLIEAKDLLAMNPTNNSFLYMGVSKTAPGQKYNSTVATRNGLSTSDITQLGYRRVSEHNRQSFQVNTQRIENSVRMANGTLRKYFVADKKEFSVSWQMLPSFRNETVDGGWGAEDLKAFYESENGQKSFNIKVNTNIYDPIIYNVIFTSFNCTVSKRGLQTYWDVDINMEQV